MNQPLRSENDKKKDLEQKIYKACLDLSGDLQDLKAMGSFSKEHQEFKKALGVFLGS